MHIYFISAAFSFVKDFVSTLNLPVTHFSLMQSASSQDSYIWVGQSDRELEFTKAVVTLYHADTYEEQWKSDLLSDAMTDDVDAYSTYLTAITPIFENGMQSIFKLYCLGIACNTAIAWEVVQDTGVRTVCLDVFDLQAWKAQQVDKLPVSRTYSYMCIYCRTISNYERSFHPLTIPHAQCWCLTCSIGHLH